MWRIFEFESEREIKFFCLSKGNMNLKKLINIDWFSGKDNGFWK